MFWPCLSLHRLYPADENRCFSQPERKSLLVGHRHDRFGLHVGRVDLLPELMDMRGYD